MSAVSIRTVVVLPAPFGPSRPRTSPRRTSRSIPRTAQRSPNRRPRPVARSITGSGVGHRSQSDRACHNRARDPTVEPPRGDGDRPPAHAQRRPPGPAPARRPLALPAPPIARRRARRRTGPRRDVPSLWTMAGHLGPAALHERPDAVRRAAARRSPSSTRRASTSASSRSRPGWAGRRVVLHVGAAESVLIVEPQRRGGRGRQGLAPRLRVRPDRPPPAGRRTRSACAS